MRSFIAWIAVIGLPLGMWVVFAVMIRRAKKGRSEDVDEPTETASTNAASEVDRE